MIIQRTPQDVELLQNIGKKVRQLREQKGLSQPALAAELGYKKSHSVWLIEAGRIAGMDIILLLRLARFFDVPVQEFLE